MYKHKKVVVFRYLDAPKEVMEELQDWHLFGNDRWLPLKTSYRLGPGEQTPANMLQEHNFRNLYDVVVKEDGFTGSFDDFLGEFTLRALYWVTSQKPDLEGVDEVILDVSW